MCAVKATSEIGVLVENTISDSAGRESGLAAFQFGILERLPPP